MLVLIYLPRKQPKKAKITDYSTFSSSSFNEAIQTSIVIGVDSDIEREFFCFYRKLNKLTDKHAPLKTISKRKNKQFSKPWITRGINKSIKVKNKLLMNGDKNRYKQYRSSITRPVRISKREYLQTYFENNMVNIIKNMGWN